MPRRLRDVVQISWTPLHRVDYAGAHIYYVAIFSEVRHIYMCMLFIVFLHVISCASFSDPGVPDYVVSSARASVLGLRGYNERHVIPLKTRSRQLIFASRDHALDRGAPLDDFGF